MPDLQESHRKLHIAAAEIHEGAARSHARAALIHDRRGHTHVADKESGLAHWNLKRAEEERRIAGRDFSTTT